MFALLIAAFAGVIVIGYFLLRRFDRFFDKGGFVPETAEKRECKKKDILLFGDDKEIAGLCRALTAAGLSVDAAELGENQGASYRWAGAFSHDDAENLLFCLSAKRKKLDILTMCKCNEPIYGNLMTNKGIDAVLGGVDTLTIIKLLKEKQTNETSR